MKSINSNKQATTQVSRRQAGLTLTELMVAVAVGLIVTTAVAGVFLQTSSSNKQNDQVGYIQDNGRYALKILADDLEMSNFWAGLSASNRTSILPDDTSLSIGSTLAVSGSTTYALKTGYIGCSSGTANWNYDFSDPLGYMNNVSASTAQGDYPCIPSMDDGNDVLMVKRTKGLEQTSDYHDGRPYIRGNRNVATVHRYVTGQTASPPSGYYDWEYIAHIYYIKDATLKRQALKEDATVPATNNPAFTEEEIASGIEKFHVVFGLDSNSDGVADYYTSSPTQAQLTDQALLAKVYVLARGSKEVVGYKNDKKYQLGDLTVNAANDGYYRRVFSTMVVMKNTEAILQMN